MTEQLSLIQDICNVHIALIQGIWKWANMKGRYSENDCIDDLWHIRSNIKLACGHLEALHNEIEKIYGKANEQALLSQKKFTLDLTDEKKLKPSNLPEYESDDQIR